MATGSDKKNQLTPASPGHPPAVCCHCHTVPAEARGRKGEGAGVNGSADRFESHRGRMERVCRRSQGGRP